MAMQVIRDAAGLAPFADGVFVPTMGALHAGHAALMRLARREADARGGAVPVAVSIFVNPTQFNERADYERYPVTLDADLGACEGAGVDAVFAPAAEVVYPPGRDVAVPQLPEVAGGVTGKAPGLEDARRPGHFAGVCQVVNRLFELVRPRVAVFGEKDWQQYRVIDEMALAEGLGVEILAGPTVREEDGLAMSSRNRFLSEEDRERALSLSRGLRAARECAAVQEAERTMRQIMQEAGVEVEYAAVRDSQTLLPLRATGDGGESGRALVAGRVGSVRLIDNMAWGRGAVPL